MRRIVDALAEGLHRALSDVFWGVAVAAGAALLILSVFFTSARGAEHVGPPDEVYTRLTCTARGATLVAGALSDPRAISAAVREGFCKWYPLPQTVRPEEGRGVVAPDTYLWSGWHGEREVFFFVDGELQRLLTSEVPA